MYFFLNDHLGSALVTTGVHGEVVSQVRYSAWGTERIPPDEPGITHYGYTGQRLERGLAGWDGLYFYNARWYDPYITQFTQPDTIIPDPYNSLDRNRYSYVRSNPINAIDPSGHMGCVDILGSIGHENEIRESSHIYTEATLDELKSKIKEEFGLETKEEGVKWSINNLRTAYTALNMINTKLNGHLKSMVGETTFTLTSGGNQYWGQTSSTGVTYHIFNGNTKIPIINFLHETGHLLDFVPATKDVFSDPFRPEKGGVTPTWVKDGYVNSDLLGDMFFQPVQAIPMNEPYDPNEYWADAFANYVAGNINLTDFAGKGQNMYDYVYGALNP